MTSECVRAAQQSDFGGDSTFAAFANGSDAKAIAFHRSGPTEYVVCLRGARGLTPVYYEHEAGQWRLDEGADGGCPGDQGPPDHPAAGGPAPP